MSHGGPGGRDRDGSRHHGNVAMPRSESPVKPNSLTCKEIILFPALVVITPHTVQAVLRAHRQHSDLTTAWEVTQTPGDSLEIVKRQRKLVRKSSG